MNLHYAIMKSMKFKKALLLNIQKHELEKEYWDKLDELCESVMCLPNGDPRIMEELVDSDCLLVNFATPVTKEMIDAAPKLKYIGVSANAFDEVDAQYAAQKNIPVCNLQGIFTESVAVFIIASILEYIRKLAEEKSRGKSGSFIYQEEDINNRRDFLGSSFGVIGLGNIGKRVAELAKAFGCDVNYWSRNQKNVPFTYKDLDELIETSDFLCVTTSLNEDTKHILNAERISRLKPGALVCIAAPMELVDVDALAKRLQEGHITFISDHAELMAEAEVAKLTPYNECILYPPIAPVTKGVRRNKQETLIQNIKACLDGQPINLVNNECRA